MFIDQAVRPDEVDRQYDHQEDKDIFCAPNNNLQYFENMEHGWWFCPTSDIEWWGKTTPCSTFSKYCKNIIWSQNMTLSFRSH